MVHLLQHQYQRVNGLTFDHILQALDADRVDQKPVMASTSTSTPQQKQPHAVAPVVVVDTKMENQKRAEELRAKLLAQRNNTPARQQPVSRSSTPAKNTLSKRTLPPVETPTKPYLPQPATPMPTSAQQLPSNYPQNTLQSDMDIDGQNTLQTDMDIDGGEMLNLDALLDQGKAMADAKSAALAAETPVVASPAPANNSVTLTNGHGVNPTTTNKNKNKNDQHKNTAKKEMNTNTSVNMNMSMSKAVPESQPTPLRVHTATRPAEPSNQPTPLKVQTATRPAEPSRPQTNLSDAYYADLPAWLEMTGFHDVEFRDSKLVAYKERKSLEEEAARIAERLEKLRQLEQESAQSLRYGTPKPAAAMAPPPLPTAMTMEKPVGQVNGNKRVHSPEPLSASKRREESGFRIRGANDSPETSRPNTAVNRRPQSPSPPGINRRISYPERRRSDDDNRSRDPSLERRQSYYRRDSNRELDSRPRGPQSSYTGRDLVDRDYDHYQPRDQPRLGFSATNMARPGRAAPAVSVPQYRGSAGLDLKRGGQFNSRA